MGLIETQQQFVHRVNAKTDESKAKQKKRTVTTGKRHQIVKISTNKDDEDDSDDYDNGWKMCATNQIKT